MVRQIFFFMSPKKSNSKYFFFCIIIRLQVEVWATTDNSEAQHSALPDMVDFPNLRALLQLVKLKTTSSFFSV